MSLFFRDSIQNEHITWDQLIQDIQETTLFNTYFKSDSYYETFKHIIVSILHNKDVILLDADFSDKEIFNVSGVKQIMEFEEGLEPLGETIGSVDDLMRLLKKGSDEWGVTLFTSGTTGTPKKVRHSFSSITRNVRESERTKDNIWGFAYNPTHMAGIQVFFQALLNQNSIVRLFGLSKDRIFSEIKSNQITHISATPSFYRLLLPHDASYPSVSRLTSGGEKFSEKVFENLNTVFPNSKITNVYASTEAGALFGSSKDIFTVKPEHLDLVKIEKDELLIHSSLVGEIGTEITEWYQTGDNVEIVSKDPLKFKILSRKNEMINVGGYKVNPTEVEELIQGLDSVTAVRVYAKKNSVLGNIICAEIVSSAQLTEAEVRTYLKDKLQEFKIPRIIRFVDSLSITRTGKIKRS